MEKDDVQLIRSILSGDDAAFSILVQKYQKSVHALVWRKVGDFHYAEEITQDTFLRAYKKLSTLKNHDQFAGWLYVIANRLCINWIRKKKPALQSLEGTRAEEVEKYSYSHYVSEHRETEATERRSEIVKKLLARLPESERTVVTLYYLGEMNAKEIGKFLSVSVKTVHSRLHRARKRLQDTEELLVQEVLGGVQLPTHLIENVMRQVADLKPTPPPVGKPLLPWAAFGATAIVVMLLLGASDQYIARFQKPYNLEAQSEATIEIVDASVVLNIDSRPTVQNQTGRAVALGKSRGNGQQIAETVLANTQEDSPKFDDSRWARTNRPHGGNVFDIFVASGGTLYAAAPTGIYRLAPDATAWTLVNTSIPIGNYRMPMAEHGDTLYIVSTDEIFTSTDNGETWNVFGSRPKGYATGLTVTGKAQGRNASPHIIMYLALQDKGVFRSTDAGTQWNLLDNGLADKSIHAVAAVGNTIFAGTNRGIYRLDSDVWQQLSVSTSESVYSVARSGNSLYIGTGPDLYLSGSLESKQKGTYQVILMDNTNSSKIFHSTDLGASWTEIVSGKKSPFISTLLSLVFLTDIGEMLSPQGVVVEDKNTFYRASPLGIYRTIDGGESWHPFMNGITGTTISDLVAINNRLYARTGADLVQSVDGGETWKTVRIDASDRVPEVIEEELSPFDFSHASQFDFSHASQLTIAGGVLYSIAPARDDLCVFHLPADSDVFVPVQGVPTFEQDEQESSSFDLPTEVEEAILKKRGADNHEKSDGVPITVNFVARHREVGGFTVSGQTFYVEYGHRLFKWKPSDSEWTDTGLIDTNESLNHEFDRGFKLAASGETVYVGKRDGKLFQSLDEGTSWKDVTPILPLRFTGFKEIVFVGSTVYVATDEGVLASQNGEHWRVLTDAMGERPVIDRFAVYHTNVYGAGNTGVYRLEDRGRWHQISPSVPDAVGSLVASNNKLYIATRHGRMFHIPLEEQW